MERREFLGRGLAGLAALGGTGLTACGGGGAPAPAGPEVGPNPGTNTGPSQAEWDGLASQFKGQVLRPGQTGYDILRLPANARYDGARPLALLRCAHSGDVQAALAFARRLQLPFVPRSGGHSYIGNSVSSGLLIDVGPMDAVQLDGEIATVGAGAKLGDVYAALIAQGRCIPSGSCVSVGIAGITLGGGVGVLDRAHGLSCDALVSARLVLADGRELDCDAQQNADLFWALRGGGGGHFGVVTRLQFRTHAVTALTQCSAQFALDDLPAVLAAWQRWPEQGLPDQVWSQLVLTPAGLRLWGVCVGDAGLLRPHWSGLISRIGRTPSVSSVQASSYSELLLGACQGLSRPQCHLPSQHSEGRLGRVAMVASSDFFDAGLDAAGAQALLAGVRQGFGVVLLNLMGGAIARVAPEATAFVHRRALFSAQYLSEFAPGTPASTLSDAEQWAHGMRSRMQAWSSGRAYQNYLDALITNPGQAYYGAHLARLQQIKAAVDPGGLFRPAQGI